MTRILVTGGGGFIGSAMVAHLRRAYPDVIVRAMDISPPNGEANEYVMGSILDETDLSLAVRGCDFVIHLAAALGVRQTENRPLHCLTVNIQGTRNVLDVCVKERVKKVVLASSSEVYGEAAVQPISEEATHHPKSVYGVSKLAAEEYVRGYADHYGLEYSIVRFFNVYGPRQKAEFVLPRFIAAVQRGRPPVVYGDGAQVRAFCYVDDASSGTAAALFEKGASGQVFNIGNPHTPISMVDLARKIIALLNGRSEPSFVPMAQSDRSERREIYARIPDIAKAQRMLGYKPKVDLDEGIRRIASAGPVDDTLMDTSRLRGIWT
ncbi:MAG: NAD-dependent epimerase/dehydratase family protein [Desulfomonile tiedjei]|nr:NAD-dependent epimerase/dehydratase family protein [Desulfomonile tiedjei]